MASIGDIDGDGFIDMLVGTPSASPVSSSSGKKVSKSGALWVTFNSLDGGVIGQQKIGPDEGGLNPELFAKKGAYGTGVSLWHSNQIVAGIPGLEAPAKNKGAGGIDILSLSAGGTVIAQTRIANGLNGAPTELLKKFSFGSSVVGIDDLDGDGVTDLAVSAPLDDNSSTGAKLAKSGAVYILFMNSNGTVKNYSRIGSDNGIATIEKGHLFGQGLAYLGDFNNTGVQVLAVGAPGYVPSNASGKAQKGAGAVHLLWLNTSGAVTNSSLISYDQTNLPLVKKDQFGWEITSTGDFDGDGVIDLAVGSPGDDITQKDGGAAYLVQLNAAGAMSSATRFSNAAHKKAGFGAALGSIKTKCYTLIATGAPLENIGANKKEGAFYFTNSEAISARMPIASEVKAKVEPELADESTDLLNQYTSESNLEVSLYPNPSNGQFKLEILGKLESNARFDVYDLLGKKVLGHFIGEKNTMFHDVIQLDNQQNGIYNLRIQNGQDVVSVKLILSK